MGVQQSLPGFDDQSRPDRYCDLVLTGGVTSAIAYPPVAFGLAQAYRFNSIGGSSSGAGSAALAAAAEYRRRHGSTDGFDKLLERTRKVADAFEGRTGLYWLFQPAPACRRLFKTLLPTFAGPKDRLAQLVFGVLSHYPGAAFGGFLLGLAYTFVFAVLLESRAVIGWTWSAVLLGLLFGLVQLAAALWHDLQAAIEADYGLCSGQASLPGAPHPPLTPWLHDLIQDIAGLPPDRPLTFADLEAAPGGPRETLGDMSQAARKSIDLCMFAANLTLGRPQLLPQRDDDEALFFRPFEMRRLFPPEVVQFMIDHATRQGEAADALEPVRAARDPAAQGDDGAFWELPRRELPVLVAARMSVSFPVLFSAVPLWQRTGGGRWFRRLLFADGGLCSNFPIHLFDNPVPAWPTFGVSLREVGGPHSLLPDRIRQLVRVPQTHDEPPADRFAPFDHACTAAQRVGGFALAMLDTVKDWNDALLAASPGVRERIAQVGLPSGIGGLNILMNEEQIRCLALLGAEAARQLLARFSTPGRDSSLARGWLEHRWVRFNVLTECLQESLVGLSKSAQFARHAEPLGEQIRRALDTPPLQGRDARVLLPAQAAALERTLDALQAIENALTPRTLEQPYQPVPRPQLRIRPPM